MSLFDAGEYAAEQAYREFLHPQEYAKDLAFADFRTFYEGDFDDTGYRNYTKSIAQRRKRMSTKCITGKVRFSYVNIFRSRSFREGQDAKFSICLLIPKEDKAGIAKIRKAIDAAVEEGIASKWGGKKPKNLRLPLRDGDEERADEAPEYEGMFFMNANSNTKPGIVDKDLNEILDPDEVYSGCWGRASVNFFPYDSNGNRGVGCGLNNIQKLKDDEHLGGARASAEDDFGDGIDEDGEEDF